MYSDPAIPNGVRGKDDILVYFTKLLARNPEWIWTHTGSLPMQDGFLNHWHASIPAGTSTVEVDGVCTVQLSKGLLNPVRVYSFRKRTKRSGFS